MVLWLVLSCWHRALWLWWWRLKSNPGMGWIRWFQMGRGWIRWFQSNCWKMGWGWLTQTVMNRHKKPFQFFVSSKGCLVVSVRTVTSLLEEMMNLHILSLCSILYHECFNEWIVQKLQEPILDQDCWCIDISEAHWLSMISSNLVSVTESYQHTPP